MEIHDLRTLYLSGLQEFCDGEGLLAQGLPAMLASAGSAQLRPALDGHAAQTAEHEKRVEAILRRHGTSRSLGSDQVTAPLLQSTERTVTSLGDVDLYDAVLVASLRRIKHHEIAACMAVAAYAAALLLEIDRRTLLGILAGKRVADRELESLEGEANQLALLVSTPAYA